MKLDFSAQKIVDYPIPKGYLPFGLVVGEGHSVWISSLITSEVMRLDASTGDIKKYYVPIEEKERTDLRGMAADSEGNIWVVATEKGKLFKTERSRTDISPITITPSPDSGPYAVDVDTTRNLVWFSEAFTDRITRFDPRTNSFVEFSNPSADAHVRRIEVDRSRPSRVWWAGDRTGKIGYIETVE